MIPLLLWGASVAYDPKPILAEMDASRTAFMACIRADIVRLGTGNAETVDNILMAVRSTCRRAEESMRSAYNASPMSRSKIEDLIIRYRSTAESDGAAALLAARHTRP